MDPSTMHATSLGRPPSDPYTMHALLTSPYAAHAPISAHDPLPLVMPLGCPWDAPLMPLGCPCDAPRYLYDAPVMPRDAPLMPL